MIVGPLLRDLGRTLPTTGVETTWDTIRAECAILHGPQPGDGDITGSMGRGTDAPPFASVTVRDPSEGGARVAVLHVGGN